MSVIWSADQLGLIVPLHLLLVLLGQSQDTSSPKATTKQLTLRSWRGKKVYRLSIDTEFKGLDGLPPSGPYSFFH